MTRDMRTLDLAELADIAASSAYPLLFATVSGAHLYGFPSRDSDIDLRGAHVLPAEQVLGLRGGAETVTRDWLRDGAEIDLVTHDVAKFLRLLLRRNGYVLEQLLSPLVVRTGVAHEQLVALAPHCITRHHAHHYRGFARSQQELFAKTGELKPLLYTFRVLLTGIHLMRSGHVEASLPALRDLVRAPDYLAELLEAKAEQEHATLAAARLGLDTDRIAADLAALHAELDAAEAASALPDAPSAEPALHDLLIRLRLAPRTPAPT